MQAARPARTSAWMNWRFWAGVPLGMLLLALAGCASEEHSLFGPGYKPSLTRPAVPGKAAGTFGLAPPAAPMAQTEGSIRVGLLLPLSGPQAALGQALLNAAQMAVYDAGSRGVTLLPRDTGSNGDTAVAAMRNAAADGAQLMIGPVFAPQVAAVKTAAGGSAVQVLALSNDAALAGPGVYIVGFTPATQVERVVRYALAHGAQRVAALIPDGAYGDLVQRALMDTLARANAPGPRIVRYAPGTTEFGPLLQDIANERGQLDALLLAEGGDNLHRIAALLPEYQLNDPRIRLLGTGLWDEENLGGATRSCSAAGMPRRRLKLGHGISRSMKRPMAHRHRALRRWATMRRLWRAFWRNAVGAPTRRH